MSRLKKMAVFPAPMPRKVIIYFYFFRFKKTLPEMEATLDEDCKDKRSIFVGALKETITEDDLVHYFSVYGKVIRAIKLTDRESGVKKTYGFVDFGDFGVVRKIMNVTKHFIQGN
jgi:heterogeneous nuclear ribonucleoprotein A1/A3